MRAANEKKGARLASGAGMSLVDAGGVLKAPGNTANAAGGGSDVLYLRRFKDVSFKNLTVRYGKYGLYPRDCASCTVENVQVPRIKRYAKPAQPQWNQGRASGVLGECGHYQRRSLPDPIV